MPLPSHPGQDPAIAPAAPPPPAPAVAPAPPAPAQGAAVAGSPVQAAEAVPLEGLPRTAQEVEGLHARREILRDQLDRAGNRRSELVTELNETGALEARAGIQQRLELLDGRILQIERDQALTERLLSNASPELLAEASTGAYAEQAGRMVDDDAAALMMFGGFGVGIVLTLLVSRFRRGRRRGAAAPMALPAEDPRLERLTQAVDAIAEEVERIGEGQRFVTQLLAGRGQATPVLREGMDGRG